jgi:antitoxin (DNA-binding transcriptional repressor) of toxin-antitoxin stability system
MEQIAVSKFKATCLSVMERVRKTRKPVLITRFGIPIAQVTPPPKFIRRAGWRGSMIGTAEIIGDIVGPISSEEDWDAARK